MYYRVTEGTFNTKEKYIGLEYYSSFGSWQGSSERNQKKFIQERLIEIPDTKPFDKDKGN